MGKLHGHPGFFNTTYCATWLPVLVLLKNQACLQCKCTPAQCWCVLKVWVRTWCGRLPLPPCPAFTQPSLDYEGMTFCSVKLTEHLLLCLWAGALKQESMLCTITKAGPPPLAWLPSNRQAGLAPRWRDASGEAGLLERISIYNPPPDRWLVLGVNVTKYWFLE